MKQAKKNELPAAVRYKPEKINRENLCTAIRCFFEIDRKTKPQTNNIVVCLYLAMIYQAVNFAENHYKEPYFNAFAHWIGKYIYPNREFLQPRPPETLTARELQTIKTHFINLLTGEICTDLAAGVYELQPFTQTNAEKRRIEAEKWKEYGITPPPKKRRKTAKQALRGYKKHSEQIQRLTIINDFE